MWVSLMHHETQLHSANILPKAGFSPSFPVAHDTKNPSTFFWIIHVDARSTSFRAARRGYSSVPSCYSSKRSPLSPTTLLTAPDLSCTNLLFDLVLNIGNPATEALPFGVRFMDGVLNAAACRNAGYQPIPVSELMPAVQCVPRMLPLSHTPTPYTEFSPS